MIKNNKINFFIKLRNIILITIEVLGIFVVYRIVFSFMLGSTINYVGGFENLTVGIAHNVLTQINKDNEVYYIQSKIVELNKKNNNILFNNNTLKANNISGFVKKIVDIEQDNKIVLENRPIIKIKNINDKNKYKFY